VVPPAPSSTTTGSTATASPSPSPSSTAATTPAPPVAPAATTRLALIPVQLTVTGSYDAVMNFIGGIQTGGRLFLVNSTTITLSPSDKTYTGVLGGTIYALPSAAAAAAAAAPSSTTATPSPVPSASTAP
jgi:hypothetical protein